MLGLFASVPVVVVNMTSLGSGEYYDTCITRPFLLQNPFKITKEQNRKCVLKLHRAYVSEHLKNPKSRVRKELGRLSRIAASGTSVRLLCHCKPKKCHGDLYVEIIKMRLNGTKWSTISRRIGK